MFYSFFISTLALILGKYVINFPFGILTGLCGMVFYSMGNYWKKHKNYLDNKWYLATGLIVWIICIKKGHLELALFECNLYPISMLAAFIGTYTIYLLSKKLPTIFSPFMSWVGQHTLLILCYHTLSFFIILNLRVYILEPVNISINFIEGMIISLSLGMILPYLHILIHSKIVKNILKSNDV